MPTPRTRNTIPAIVSALTLTAVSLILWPMSPAQASSPATSTTPGQSCWVVIDTGESGCFDTGLDPITQIEDATGTTLVAEPTGAQPKDTAATPQLARGTLVSYVVSALWSGPNQTGDSATYLTTNSAICSGFTYGYPSLGTFNDLAQSFQSFNGCRTTLYQDANYLGLHIGPATSAPNLGSFNNTVSSIVASA